MMSKKWAFPSLSPSVTLEPQAIGAMPGRAILASLTEPYTCHPREGGDLHCKSPPLRVTIPNAIVFILRSLNILLSRFHQSLKNLSFLGIQLFPSQHLHRLLLATSL